MDRYYQLFMCCVSSRGWQNNQVRSNSLEAAGALEDHCGMDM